MSSGKGLRLGQKAANQPAFIRIGEDKPKHHNISTVSQPRATAMPAAQTASVRSGSGLQPADRLDAAHSSSLAATDSAVSAAGPGAVSAAGPGVVSTAAPGAGYTALSGAVPTIAQAIGDRKAALLAASRTASDGKTAVHAAAQARPAGTVADDVTANEQHSTMAVLCDIADRTPPVDAAQAVTLSGVNALPVQMQDTADRAEATTSMTPPSAAPVSTAATDSTSLHAVAAAAAATDATGNLVLQQGLSAGAVSTVATPVSQAAAIADGEAEAQQDTGANATPGTSEASPASQPMLLPTSRRKRKGQKAAKIDEPVRGNSWRELLGRSSAADTTAVAKRGKSTQGQCLFNCQKSRPSIGVLSDVNLPDGRHAAQTVAVCASELADKEQVQQLLDCSFA